MTDIRTDAVNSLPVPLRDREREILVHLVGGLSNQAIAVRLHLALRTVKRYRSQIYGKLGVSNRQEAVKRVAELGLLTNSSAASITHPKPHLPTQATTFVGRQQEIADLIALLNNSACRLLTLVGPGGIGKTRLAIEVAHSYSDEEVSATLRLAPTQFVDGVYFVPLQALTSPDFIVSSIAAAIDFHFYPGDPKQQLFNYLRDKTLLLLLDNFEHLIDGAELLSEILNAAPGVRILVTSRERLHLMEEWVFDVRELKYPANEAVTDIEDYDAVQLFVQHAGRVHTSFTLTSTQKPAVIRICCLVGGMPLGIELAAARTRALPCAEIAEEIERSLDILETPTRNVEPRHRNIRAAFEPMWDRLSDKQRSVFKKLSIFRGGFTREAAERVAGASVQTLSTLVDRSLVRLDDNGRYDLHELLRQYAEERLHETAMEWQDSNDQHCRYFVTFLAEKEKHLEGKQQKRALEEIQHEIDNIRAAWQWAVEQEHVAEIGEVAHALWFFYDTRSWYEEGEEAFRVAVEALSVGESNRSTGLAFGQVLARHGAMCFSRNMTETMRNHLEKSLIVLRHYDAHKETGFPLLRLGEVAMFVEGDPLAAQAYLRQSLIVFREADHRWGIAYSLRWLGFASFHLEQYQEGLRLAQEGLAIYKEHDDTWGIAITLGVLGFCMLEMETFAEAKRLGKESLALCREIGLEWAALNALILIGTAALGLGKIQEGKKCLYETLERALDRQLMPYVMASLEETARLLITTGKKEEGAAILAFVLQYPYPPLLGKRRTARRFAQLERELSSERFAVAVERGEALELEAVIRACLDELRPLAEMREGFNERELEILRLIDKGLSNSEIATEVILSLSTVKWYTHQIYSKLSVRSRTQALRRAKALGLLA